MKEQVQTGASASTKRLHLLARQIEDYQAQIARNTQTLEETRGELRKSHVRYAELYAMAPLGFLTLDRRGVIREVNDTVARLVNFPSAWLIDRPFVVFVARHDVPRFLTFMTRSIRSDQPNTIALELHANGREFPVQLSVRTSTGTAILHRMTILDLTDAKKTESQLHEAVDNWRSLVHNVPDIIVTVDRNGKIVFMNRPWWGRSVRKMIGTHIYEYFIPQEQKKIRACIDSAFISGQSSSCEVTGVQRDRMAWFSFSFGSVEGASTATLMIREISKYKRAEESLRVSGEQMRDFAARLEAVREEERTRLAREIHDELGQALTVLKLDLSWLQSKTPRGQTENRKKMKAVIAYVDQTIDRVRRIASDLRPSVLDDLGLLPAIEWQVSEFAKRTGIRCHLDSAVKNLSLSPEISAAAFRVLQEALTNIMRHAHASAVRVGVKVENGYLKLAVTDNGKGIKKSDIQDLKSLGIVGMNERIARVGGELQIQRGPKRGTRVEIILPVEI